MGDTMGAALAVVAALGIAGQALAIRLATRRGQTTDVLLVNISISAVSFAALSLLLVPDPVVTPTSILAFASAGLVSLVAGRGLYFAGIKRIGLNRAEPIKSSMPLHATVFAVVLLGERVTATQLIGIVVIIIGVVLISLEGATADRVAGRDVPWTGLALPLCAALLFALEPILVFVGFREGTSVLVGGAIMTWTGLVALSSWLGWRRAVPRPSKFPVGDVRWYVLSGVAGAVTILAYYTGLSISRVSVVVPIMQMSPLVVVAVSALFLRDLERVTLQIVVAAGIIIAGAMTVTLTG